MENTDDNCGGLLEHNIKVPACCTSAKPNAHCNEDHATLKSKPNIQKPTSSQATRRRPRKIFKSKLIQPCENEELTVLRSRPLHEPLAQNGLEENKLSTPINRFNKL